ncbi:MAG: hypothetical protein WB983_13875, partial [Terriglobales bacterium]
VAAYAATVTAYAATVAADVAAIAAFTTIARVAWATDVAAFMTRSAALMATCRVSLTAVVFMGSAGSVARTARMTLAPAVTLTGVALAPAVTGMPLTAMRSGALRLRFVLVGCHHRDWHQRQGQD